MNPKKPSKKRAGDETFKPQQDKTSTSTVESRPASAERQPRPKRKMADATYKPQAETPSTSTLETEKRRSPGRPRRNAKPATYLQPRATSEATELRLEQHGTPIPQNAPATGQSSSSSSSSDGASLSTTDRLKNMRDFLTVEDALTHPRFGAECDAIETFLSDLAGAKEMFDVSVYHDVKAMLRMHRERMIEMERERNEVVTYKVPSYSTTECTTESGGSRAAGVTYRMPSFSTAESELRARVFSPEEGARGAETDGTSVDGMEGWDDYGDGDTADVFHGGWSSVRTSERDHGSAVARGKRPAGRAAAQRPGHAAKTLRRTEQEDEPTWLKEKPPKTTYLPTSSRTHEYDQNDDLVDLVARSESTPKSGSLIPPEIADFGTLDEGEELLPATTRKSKTTPWKNDVAVDSNDDEENDPLRKFYPGDPVFMFGETKYLQALQSRRMEKDLAADDEETQAAIDARPLMGMFARFRLPDAGAAALEIFNE
ncbi:MAG: hypothetical protein LQ344_005926 [Seirophora lacunosa]|nr:MAG: hypothetical protein LQ344_005926 [Seirophora lacunosa]